MMQVGRAEGPCTAERLIQEDIEHLYVQGRDICAAAAWHCCS